jgi:DNA-binding NtrC family response regulator
LQIASGIDVARNLVLTRMEERKGMTTHRVVLISDAAGDEAGAMGSLLGALSEAGAMTEMFTDWAAGFRSAVLGGTDMLVIDLDTPSLGGMEAMIEIGRIASRIPVLLLSAHESRARRMWAVGAGVKGYVTKPCDEETIVRFIAKCIGEA